MTEQITFISTFLSIYGIAISAILILRSNLSKQQAVIFLLFICSLISYLLMDEGLLTGVLFNIFLTGAFLLPFSFWKLSRSIFSDNEQPLLRFSLETLAVISTYWCLAAIGRSSEEYWPYTVLIMKSISITLLLLSIVESQRGKKGDLVKSRLRLRTTFIYFVVIIGLITVMTETYIGTTNMLKLKMVQRIAILSFTSYFLIVNSAWQKSLFNKRTKPLKVKNQHAIDQINKLMYDEKFYKKEGLTIGQLAEVLNEQEYKLRSVINQEMGYRNFPAFVNSFRITEAKVLLLSQSDMTIQEVAFETGFNSIGPFNRAFKSETGMTPKVFRDQKRGK